MEKGVCLWESDGDWEGVNERGISLHSLCDSKTLLEAASCVVD